MGKEAAPLYVAPAAWCDEAEAALMPAAFGDMPLVRAEVLQGISRLWKACGATEGWIVTRQEPGELVLVLGAGRNCRPLIRYVMQRAKDAGLRFRTHVRRPGLKRIYEQEGATLAEYVMRA